MFRNEADCKQNVAGRECAGADCTSGDIVQAFADL